MFVQSPGDALMALALQCRAGFGIGDLEVALAQDLFTRHGRGPAPLYIVNFAFLLADGVLTLLFDPPGEKTRAGALAAASHFRDTFESTWRAPFKQKAEKGKAKYAAVAAKGFDAETVKENLRAERVAADSVRAGKRAAKRAGGGGSGWGGAHLSPADLLALESMRDEVKTPYDALMALAREVDLGLNLANSPIRRLAVVLFHKYPANGPPKRFISEFALMLSHVLVDLNHDLTPTSTTSNVLSGSFTSRMYEWMRDNVVEILCAFRVYLETQSVSGTKLEKLTETVAKLQVLENEVQAEHVAARDGTAKRKFQQRQELCEEEVRAARERRVSASGAGVGFGGGFGSGSAVGGGGM